MRKILNFFCSLNWIKTSYTEVMSWMNNSLSWWRNRTSLEQQCRNLSLWWTCGLQNDALKIILGEKIFLFCYFHYDLNSSIEKCWRYARKQIKEGSWCSLTWVTIVIMWTQCDRMSGAWWYQKAENFIHLKIVCFFPLFMR
jgi:hypothetical protein